jgi:hypothetical protein
MVGGRNIIAILKGGIVKGFTETVVMGWVHGGWQKYYSYTDRGIVKGFGAKCCLQRGILLPSLVNAGY